MSRAEDHQLDLHPQPVAAAADADADADAAAARPGHAAKGVTHHEHVTAGAGALWGDTERVGQVLATCWTTHCAHTPTGGHVTVAIDRANGGVRFTVTDTGEGIDGVHVPHVIERFYRADPPAIASVAAPASGWPS